MSFENGAQAANEAVVADQNTDGQVAANETAADQTEGDGAENTEGEEGERQAAAPEFVEVTLEDGRKVKVPKDVEGHLLRQADYTRKTQEVAEQKRALEAEREQFKGHTEAQKAHFKAATKLAALDEQIAPYAKMTQQEWANLRAQDPNAFQDHWVNYDILKNQRDTANREFSDLENNRRQTAERENANRTQKALADIARLVPDWTPGGELDVKLSKYGTGLGFSQAELGEMAIRNPQFVHQLNRLRVYDEAAAKQKTQQQFQASQQAQPVTRVGGQGGSATRKTTDASGDQLSAEEWVKRESERLRKKA